MNKDFQDGSDYNESNPVSLTKDGPNMKAWEEMRAPEDVHNIIIRSAFIHIQYMISILDSCGIVF